MTAVCLDVIHIYASDSYNQVILLWHMWSCKHVPILMSDIDYIESNNQILWNILCARTSLICLQVAFLLQILHCPQTAGISEDSCASLVMLQRIYLHCQIPAEKHTDTALYAKYILIFVCLWN